MLRLILVMSLFVLTYFSCERAPVITSQPASENFNSNVISQTFASKIVGSEEARWSPQSLKVVGSETLEFLRVFDSKTIAAIGEGNTLYQSIDGGATWRTSEIPVGRRARISSAFFLGPLRAVLAIIRPRESKSAEAYDSWILTTTNGGQDWIKSLTVDNSILRDFAFDSNGAIWVVGGPVRAGQPTASRPFIASSSNLVEWQKVAPPETMKGPLDHLIIRSDLSKVFVSEQGAIVEQDGAGNWMLPENLGRIRPDQIGISSIAEFGDTLFLIGATGGREGRWTSMFSRAGSTTDWTHRELVSVNLRDLIAVSARELFACGSITDDPETSSASGIILHSFDSGATWLVSHRSTQIRGFTKVSIDDAGSIWAAGENGTLVRLKLVKD